MDSKNSAACSSERNSDDDAKSQLEDEDDELDFFSPKFNPRRALLASEVKIPFQDIKTFTSVQSYQEAVKRKQSRSRSRSRPRNDDNENSSHKTGESRESGPSGSRSRSSDQPSSSRSSWRSTDASRTGSRSTFTTPHRPTSKTVTLQGEKIIDLRTRISGRFRSKSSAADLTLAPQPSTSLHSKKLDKPDSFRKEQEKLPLSDDREICDEKASGSKANQSGKSQRNVLKRMAKMTGPLQLMTKCAQQKLHVRIMTRGAVLVRSICRGYIVAFDSHFNMALIDVEEYYRRPAILGKVRARRTEKLQAAQKLLQEERRKLAEQINQLEHEKPCPMKDSEHASQDFTGDEGVKTSNQEKGVDKSVHEGLLRKSTENVERDSSVENLQALKTDSDSKSSRAQLTQMEREALIMGIPIENVEHRHLNQLFIRGENVVLVSIIND